MTAHTKHINMFAMHVELPHGQLVSLAFSKSYPRNSFPSYTHNVNGSLLEDFRICFGALFCNCQNGGQKW
jgi:hypothetical protein